MVTRGRHAAALAAALALALPAAASSSTDAGEVSASKAPGVSQTLAACLKSTPRLLVVIAIDRSLSVRRTDPDARRVDGAIAALRGFHRLATNGHSGQPVEVEVVLGHFAAQAAPLPAQRPWRSVRAEDLARLERAAEAYKRIELHRDTDFVIALDNAHRLLRQRAGQESRRTCKAVVFVSDGRYKLAGRADRPALPQRVRYARRLPLRTRDDANAVVKLGRERLCRPRTGLLDRMVADGILTFFVALSRDAASSEDDRDYLASLAYGSAPGAEPCGARVSPETGAFFDASALDLYPVLANLADGPEIGPPRRGTVCADAPCHEGGIAFVAEPGIADFVLDAGVLRPVEQLAITPPSGATRTVAPDDDPSIDVGGVTLTQHWIGRRSLELRGSFPRDERAWQGEWVVTLLAPPGRSAGSVSYTLRLTPDLRPRLDSGTRLVRGETATIRLGLVDGSGRASGTTRLARTATVIAFLRPPESPRARAVPARRDGDGSFVIEAEIPADAREDDWHLDVTTTFEGSDGTLVKPRLTSLQLPLVEDPPPPPPWPWIAAALTVAGVLAWLLWRDRRARFVRPKALRALALPARVGPGGLVLPAAEDPDRPTDYDAFTQLSERGRASVHRVDHDRFTIRTRGGWRPSSPPYGRASAEGCIQMTGARSREAPPAPDRVAHTSLELARTWLFAVDRIEEDGTAQGTLLLLRADGDGDPDGGKVLAAAREELVGRRWEPPGASRGSRAPRSHADGDRDWIAREWARWGSTQEERGR